MTFQRRKINSTHLSCCLASTSNHYQMNILSGITGIMFLDESTLLQPSTNIQYIQGSIPREGSISKLLPRDILGAHPLFIRVQSLEESSQSDIAVMRNLGDSAIPYLLSGLKELSVSLRYNKCREKLNFRNCIR